MVVAEAGRPPRPGHVAARDDLHRLGREQAALRRVAELVAHGAPATDVFGAVAAEAAGLLDGQATTLTRFDGDAALVVVAAPAGPAPVGAHIAFGRDTLPDRVLRTADVVRVDDYTGQPDAELAASFGLGAAVSAPVLVAGEVWGMLTATSGDHPLPRDTGPRLEQFARLVAAALGTSQARSDLRALAAEQAALRRVAELVARGTASDEVFVAVTDEASALFGDLPVALMLYDDTGAVVVATCHCPAPVGLHVPFSAGTAVDRLYRTGRPAHVDTYEGTPMAGIAREAGIASTTAVPITVEGRVRATLVSSNTLPATRDAVEARLTQFAELAAVAIANAEPGRSSPPRGRASSPPPTRPADASSATCTTARSSGSSTRSSRSSSPGTPSPPAPRRPTSSTRPWPTPSAPTPSSATSSTASCRGR